MATLPQAGKSEPAPRSARLEARTEAGQPGTFVLADGKTAVLGRGAEADWKVEGEPLLSRRHAELRIEGDAVAIRRLPQASNPIFYQGRQAAEVKLRPGEHFVVGRTRFLLAGLEPAPCQPAEDGEPGGWTAQTLTAGEIYALAGVAEGLEGILELPGFAASLPPAEFHLRTARLILRAAGGCWACLAASGGQVLAAAGDPGTRMSRSLLRTALASMPRPTLYFWSCPPPDLEATAQAGIDWAICAAAPVTGEPPLVFYVAGRGGTPEARRGAAQFVGLAADLTGRTLSLRRLEGWQTRLEHFFSPAVAAKILDSGDVASLRPRLAKATVMFMDLRGFSRRSETNANILAYLNELRGVLTLLTGRIMAENGVVIQYEGDAIMACWNVPVADPGHADQACRAALDMVETLRTLEGEWRCGIGVHTGETVAGAIGSEQVWSYGVLGPIVNQASRIEGITKQVGAPILVSGEVAALLSPEGGSTRRLGRFRPAGMEATLEIHELSRSPLPAEPLEAFRRGQEAFERGDWNLACSHLGTIAGQDPPSAYLLGLAKAHAAKPPRPWEGSQPWDGTIVLDKK